jgi:hypothetical protein
MTSMTRHDPHDPYAPALEPGTNCQSFIVLCHNGKSYHIHVIVSVMYNRNYNSYRYSNCYSINLGINRQW